MSWMHLPLWHIWSGEPAAERVRSILGAGEEEKCHIYISIINLGEVLYNMERNHGLSKVAKSLSNH